MFLLGYTLAAVAFLFPVPHERSTVAFDLAACSAHATDIVVTDRDGRVRECWRGELKPGDVVRLGAEALTPANALPWACSRLRPDRALSGIYARDPNWHFHERYPSYEPPGLPVWPKVPEVTDTEFGLVLFLRNAGTTGAGTIWVPASTPPGTEDGEFDSDFDLKRRRRGYRPARSVPTLRTGWSEDFTTSIAWVEAGRVVTQQCEQLVPVALTLAHFKADALARPGPPANALKWDASPPNSGTPTEDPAARILSGALRWAPQIPASR